MHLPRIGANFFATGFLSGHHEIDMIPQGKPQRGRFVRKAPVPFAHRIDIQIEFLRLLLLGGRSGPEIGILERLKANRCGRWSSWEISAKSGRFMKLEQGPVIGDFARRLVTISSGWITANTRRRDYVICQRAERNGIRMDIRDAARYVQMGFFMQSVCTSGFFLENSFYELYFRWPIEARGHSLKNIQQWFVCI